MQLDYEPKLDGLRAIAILALLGYHLLPGLMTGGSLGVDAFFVLSGYLITSILVREATNTGRIRYRAFILRRARRLLPALTVMLASYVVLCPILWPQLAYRRWLDVGVVAFYVANLRHTFWPVGGPLQGLWSLSVEEQFYLLWPFVLAALLQLSRSRAAALLFGIWGALTLARVLCARYVPGPAAYYFTPLHATGLLLGSAFALRPVRLGFGGAALAGLAMLALAGHTKQTFFYTIPSGEILTVLVIADLPKLLAAPPLVFLGRTSYGAYLWGGPTAWAIGYSDLPHALASIAATPGSGRDLLLRRGTLVLETERLSQQRLSVAAPRVSLTGRTHSFRELSDPSRSGASREANFVS